MNPMIRKAMEKHYREWEGLMKRHAYRWAAYHGDVRLEIGKTKHDLYSKYLKRGIKKEELVVLGIGPPLEDEYEQVRPEGCRGPIRPGQDAGRADHIAGSSLFRSTERR